MPGKGPGGRTPPDTPSLRTSQWGRVSGAVLCCRGAPGREVVSAFGKPQHQTRKPAQIRGMSLSLQGAGQRVTRRGRHRPTVRGGRRACRQPRVGSNGPRPGANLRTVHGPPDHGHQGGPRIKGGPRWGQGAGGTPGGGRGRTLPLHTCAGGPSIATHSGGLLGRGSPVLLARNLGLRS